MIRRPPRSTHCISSAASDVYKRQGINAEYMGDDNEYDSEGLKIRIPKYNGNPNLCAQKGAFTLWQIHNPLNSQVQNGSIKSVSRTPLDKFCLLYTSPSPRDQA
eukprot:TRINITY_DN15437_c0_g1_i3.p1 TRINITY_DN15437_c0_g1~~TRINITY_DN15437_c0_g1_i3.p1  ORF type:complete len:104 (-),score=30.83 TRINITY_DN15437_c0_g1_i3:72-383(-)